jgi:hypothetical protein
MKKMNLGLVWGLMGAGYLGGIGQSLMATPPILESSNIWEDSMIYPFGDIALTDKRIDQFMERLSKTNPQRASELQALRAAEPEQFRLQVRNEMTNRFFQSTRQSTGGLASDTALISDPNHPVKSGPEYLELIAWLEKNFPRQAAELKAVSSDARVAELVDRYGPVMIAEHLNPPLAAVMKEDIAIQMQSDELLMDLRYATDTEREALIKELENLTSQRFDLIVRKREIQYEQLRQRLEKLQKNLEKQKAELDKLKAHKENTIGDRVTEMVEYTQKANWN